jgi:glycosyltransferase involved in cell wall biosynthesis
MQSKKLTILIPCLERDSRNCEKLMTELRHPEVEIIAYLNKGQHTIGHFRNELVEWTKTPYLCFVDADDSVSPNYIETLLKGIATNPDVISLRGIYTLDGGSPAVFEHSIKYSEWRTTYNPIKYERYINHLNCIKSDIAKQIKYEDIKHGEDWEYSKELQASGLVKTEYYTDEILYNYKYISNK